MLSPVRMAHSHQLPESLVKRVASRNLAAATVSAWPESILPKEATNEPIGPIGL